MKNPSRMPPQRRGAFYGRDIAVNPKTLSQAHTEGFNAARRDHGRTPGARVSTRRCVTTGERPARQGGERGAPSNGTSAARGNPICARWRAGVRVCVCGRRYGRGRGCVRACRRMCRCARTYKKLKNQQKYKTTNLQSFKASKLKTLKTQNWKISISYK